IPRAPVLLVVLGLDDQILQQPVGGDACGKRLDLGLGVWHLPHVLKRLFKFVEGNEQNVSAFGCFLLAGHGVSPLRQGSARKSAHEPLPFGENGGSKGMGGGWEGDHPPEGLRGTSGSAQRARSARRKTGETRLPARDGARTLPRARGGAP